MSYWTVILLVLAIAYLAYRHPQAMLQYLPTWFQSAEQRISGQGASPSRARDDIKSPEIEISNVQIRVQEDETADEETTPKPKATEPQSKVPSLSLDGNDKITTPESRFSNGSTTLKSKATPNAGLMPPPPRPRPSTNTPNGLMPPPPRPTLAPPPNAVSALRVPSTGPLPNRGPPANSQQRVGGGLSANGIVAVPNPRGKVLLSPGHSPMDWAALTKFSNLSGMPSFQRVTPSMLKNMTGRKGKPAWSSWQGKVYNITPYLDFHPGGRAELMKAAGRDGTKLFMDVHPWVNWENMLEACLVGALVPEGYGMQQGGTDLEDID